jgi:site-specific DNA recombinase
MLADLAAGHVDGNADAGIPHRGSTHPFCYEPDHVTIRADGAEVHRQIVARFLAGESARSIASWLDEQQVPTATARCITSGSDTFTGTP